MKAIEWNPHARAFVQALSKAARRELGTLLLLLQDGASLGMPLARKMSAIHRNAWELRIKDDRGQVRVIYVTLTNDRILIPHAFIKKSQKTPKREIALARERLRDMQ